MPCVYLLAQEARLSNSAYIGVVGEKSYEPDSMSAIARLQASLLSGRSSQDLTVDSAPFRTAIASSLCTALRLSGPPDFSASSKRRSKYFWVALRYLIFRCCQAATKAWGVSVLPSKVRQSLPTRPTTKLAVPMYAVDASRDSDVADAEDWALAKVAKDIARANAACL